MTMKGSKRIKILIDSQMAANATRRMSARMSKSIMVMAFSAMEQWPQPQMRWFDDIFVNLFKSIRQMADVLPAGFSTQSPSHVDAAIDRNGGAGDELGQVAQQVNGGIGDIFWRPDAAKGAVGEELGPSEIIHGLA